MVKTNAAEALSVELARGSWRREVVVFAGSTDCYQPLEGRYKLTRELLTICLAHKNPAGVITKSPLIRRDLDVHQFAHEECSLAFGHHFISRLIQEPKAEARTRAAFERLIRESLGLPQIRYQ